MAEPIQVKITDDTGTSTISAGNVSQNNPNKPINQSVKENKKASVLTTASHMVLMRSINYTTSNVGKWTGSNRLQNQINTTKQLIGYGVAFAVNPVLGAVTVAMDGLTNVIDYAYEDKWNRIKSEQAVARSGGKGGYRR